MPPAQPLTWQERLASVDAALRMPAAPGARPWPGNREILYVVEARTQRPGPRPDARGCPPRAPSRRDLSKAKPANLDPERVHLLPDLSDRRIIASWKARPDLYGQWNPRYGQAVGRYVLPQVTLEALLPLICATGRCWLQIDAGAEDRRPLRWDDGPPWKFALAVQADSGSSGYAVIGWLQRDEARVDLALPLFSRPAESSSPRTPSPRLDDSGAFAWIAHLHEHGLSGCARHRWTTCSRGCSDSATSASRSAGSAPLRGGRRRAACRGCGFVRAREWRASRLLGELSFEYAARWCRPASPASAASIPGSAA